jgi:hypothetical protein
LAIISEKRASVSAARLARRWTAVAASVVSRLRAAASSSRAVSRAERLSAPVDGAM